MRSIRRPRGRRARTPRATAAGRRRDRSRARRTPRALAALRPALAARSPRRRCPPLRSEPAAAPREIRSSTGAPWKGRRYSAPSGGTPAPVRTMRPCSRNAEPSPVPIVIPSARSCPRAAPAHHSPRRNASASFTNRTFSAPARARRPAPRAGRPRRATRACARADRSLARSRTAPAPRHRRPRRLRDTRGARRVADAVEELLAAASRRRAPCARGSPRRRPPSRRRRWPRTRACPPTSSATTAPSHLDQGLDHLARRAASSLQPVAGDARGDHQRLGVREDVGVAAYGLDRHLLARDEVQHVEPPLRLDGDLVLEVEAVDGEEELVQLAESELGESRARGFHDRLLDRGLAEPSRRGGSGRDSRRRGRDGRVAARPSRFRRSQS